MGEKTGTKIEIHINNDLNDKDGQTTGAAVEHCSCDKSPNLRLSASRVFNIDIIKFCWPSHFFQFYNPDIMSYTCNKCGKVVSDKWAHNIEHAFKKWDEEQVPFKF